MAKAKYSVAIRCSGGCDQFAEVQMPIKNVEHLGRRMRAVGWYVSVLSPQGTNPIVLGVTCEKCAKREMPEIFAALGKGKAS